MSVEPVTVPPDVTPFSPPWWTARLYGELVARQGTVDLMRRYTDGDHDHPTVEARASRAFRRIMGLSVTNLSGLIVEATAERMAVQGFRFGGDPAADKDAWRIWQASDFDADSELAITAALTDARSFVLVEPPRSPDAMPRLYAEDASQMIVAYAPGNRRARLAALKVWRDEWSADLFATLYLPGSLHKYRADSPQAGSPARPIWELRTPGVAGEVNRLGEVPVFELENRPRLGGPPRSEIADVIPDQDRANHIALNALIAAEYGAFRQKWATGIEVPRDENGDPVEPFDVAVNRALISESSEARFGDFNATDLKPYIDLYESTVKHMAAVSQTPVSVLLGTPSNVSAEALALSITGLVNKVKRRAKHYEQAFESAMRLAFRSMGDPRAEAVDVETVWADPEIRSKAQDADAAVKLVQSGVIPPQQAQEDLGYTEPQRTRMLEWARENDALGGLAGMFGDQVDTL